MIQRDALRGGVMEPTPRVGQRLAAARLQRGLSQGTVARRAGIAPSYLSRIENSKLQPSFRTVFRVVRAMHVPFEEIAGVEPGARHPKGACPISHSGHCMLDLIHSEFEVAHEPEAEAFTPRQIRLLRRFAAWMRTVPQDRQRAMEILLDELGRAGRPGG